MAILAGEAMSGQGFIHDSRGNRSMGRAFMVGCFAMACVRSFHGAGVLELTMWLGYAFGGYGASKLSELKGEA